MSKTFRALRAAGHAALVAAPALLLGPIWIAHEYQLATERVRASVEAAAVEGAARIDEVVGRFERATAGLRPVDAAGEPAALAARLLRTEVAIAPAGGLLVASTGGRLLAAAGPGSGTDVSGEWWLTAGLAAEPGRVLVAGPDRLPLGAGEGIALLRRVTDAAGRGVVVAAFVTGERLQEAARPATMPAGATLALHRTRGADGTPPPASSPDRAGEVVAARRPAARNALTLEITPRDAAVDEALADGLAARLPLVAGAALLLGVLVALALSQGRRRGSAAEPEVSQAAALEDAERRVATALAERDRLLAAVGHDVRSPLNGILGIVALLLEGDLDDAQRRWLLQVRASCEVLTAMLNGMLEVANSAADGRELLPERVEVADLMREVAEVFRPMAHDKGLDLSFASGEGAGGAWIGDATRLRQVACNLIGNAVKYTDSGAVAVTLTRTDHGLAFEVTDTGPGITEGERARIFERFGRGRQEVSGGREGLGLGLALCQEIASLMGGALDLTSEPGRGSTFRFSFPAEPAKGALSPPLLRGRVGLVIGFSEGVRRRTVEALESLGCVVESAPDGFLGLGLAERAAHEEGTLDLVVLDAAISGLPAEAVLARLGSSRTLRDARVVLVGGEGRSWSGVAAALPHPVEETALIGAVRRLFGAAVPGFPATATAASGAARVLVAEDNSVNRSLLLDALGRAGFTAFGAKDGLEAVQAASRGGFDAIVMDVQMPVLDGIEAIHRIRATLPEARLPILALTAHTRSTTRRALLAAGATAVLHKPVDLGRLIGRLRDAIAIARETPRLDIPSDSGEVAPAVNGHVLDRAWLGAFVLEHGWTRARALVEALLVEIDGWLTRTAELVEAREWAASARAGRDLLARVEDLGTFALSEALEDFTAAAGAAADEAAVASLETVRETWRRTAPALVEAIRRGGPGRRRDPQAA